MLLTLLSFWTAACAPAPVVDDVAPPRLVVLVAVDQLIPEQLDRLAPHLDGGLGRFHREGLVFRAAQLEYAITATGPGHATFATGRNPSGHGIVGNVYYDRVLGERIYCVADADSKAVTSEGIDGEASASSPRNLFVDGLADYLRTAFPGSRAVSIAGKDRAAVCLGGKRPVGAFWWDRAAGGFASSSWYASELPEWVREWNGTWLEKASGFTWEPTFSDLSSAGTAPDDRPGESPYGEFGITFPYALPESDGTSGVAALAGLAFQYPVIDAFVAELAVEAVDALDLGRDDEPDLLAVGFSGCDVIGHSFGPYSVEVTDLILRTDDALGRLFDELDDTVGEGRWVACLSSDHGVLELPEALQARGVPAGRITREDEAELVARVKESLVAEFGADFSVAYYNRELTFDVGAASAAEVEPAAVRRVMQAAATEIPWVDAAFTWDELASGAPSDVAVQRLFAASFWPARFPDVVLHTSPGLVTYFQKGTSHGTAHAYDRRIPLAFLGPGFPAAVRFDRASSADALPTLLHALGIDVPDGLDGRVLLRE